MFTPLPLRAKRSYDESPDYIDTHGQEIRINKKRPNEKQVGRFTIIDDLEPNKSYEDYPDYINERGQEVRINRKRPNEKQVGRFTIIDYIGGEKTPKIVGRVSKDINLYPNKKVGRFTIKSFVISQKRKSNSRSPSRRTSSKRKSRSPSRSIKFTNLRIASPKLSSKLSSPKKIGRFTLTRKK